MGPLLKLRIDREFCNIFIQATNYTNKDNNTDSDADDSYDLFMETGNCLDVNYIFLLWMIWIMTVIPLVSV